MINKFSCLSATIKAGDKSQKLMEKYDIADWQGIKVGDKVKKRK